MIIRRATPRPIGPNEPYRHQDHPRPRTRREFLSQGFIAGSATAFIPSVLGMMASPKVANALSTDMELLKSACNISNGAGMIPMIIIDLAGGANLAGSNVMVGMQNQLDVLSVAGYGKLGLPPSFAPQSSTPGPLIDSSMGLVYQTDSAHLRGINTKMAATRAANINGAIMPAMTNNDTNVNPINAIYAIAMTGAKGALVTIAGSQNSVTGGNSTAPADQINPELQPTKISSPVDVVNLAPGGSSSTPTLFTGNSAQADGVGMQEAIARMSKMKLDAVDTLLGPSGDTAAKLLVQCNYVKPANTAEAYNGVASLDPRLDTDITGLPTSIFTAADMADGDFSKVAAMMKLIVNGHGGAGVISFGGYDYHTGNRMVGEAKDFKAGQAIGAIIEYAARKNQPVVVQIISDGSVTSTMTIDSSAGGRGKFGWQGDSQAQAASYFLVYNPASRPVLTGPDKNQIGSFKSTGDVNGGSSVCANSPKALVDVMVANYLALHNQLGRIATLFPNSALNNPTLIDNHVAFAPIRPM